MAGLLLARLMLRVLDWLFKSRIGTSLNVRSVAVPLGIVIAVAAYRQTVALLGVQIVARGATDWIAVTILWLGVCGFWR